MNPVPALIVSGYLGSGKTTLVGHLLVSRAELLEGAVEVESRVRQLDPPLERQPVDPLLSRPDAQAGLHIGVVAEDPAQVVAVDVGVELYEAGPTREREQLGIDE